MKLMTCKVHMELKSDLAEVLIAQWYHAPGSQMDQTENFFSLYVTLTPENFKFLQNPSAISMYFTCWVDNFEGIDFSLWKRL